MPSPDEILMQKIFSQYHGLLSSLTVAVPESLVAALIANESGGNPAITRFEPSVFTGLSSVLLGLKSSYGILGTQHILLYVAPEDASGGSAVPPVPGGFVGRMKRLKDLATSWGLTQIMGFNALAKNKSMGALSPGNPKGQIQLTLELLDDFVEEFHLDPWKASGDLFHCWNGGSPNSPTFDPNYPRNGLARMALYETIAKAATSPAAATK
jgi:hypothetical protein